MVTVLMAILIFMGIGWQFAFEQWGIGIYKEYTFPIAYLKDYITVANDYVNAASVIKITKISNSKVSFMGRADGGKIYESPYVGFLSVGF